MDKVVRGFKRKSRYQKRNEFFSEEIYEKYRSLFKSWGYKFHRSVRMSPEDTESEAIRIALEQTDLRMDELDDEWTVPHILHATKQRLINLCNRQTAQKRNNYETFEGYYCKCGRELYEAGECECGLLVQETKIRRKAKITVSSESLREGSIDEEDGAGLNYSKEYLTKTPAQEEQLFLKEFLRELKKEMSWRYKSSKVKTDLIIIYELLVEEGYSEKDVCRLMDLEDSTFYLYRSRIMECYYIVKDKLDGKYARKDNKQTKINIS
jgi:hypothetical protein